MRFHKRGDTYCVLVRYEISSWHNSYEEALERAKESTFIPTYIVKVESDNHDWEDS